MADDDVPKRTRREETVEKTSFGTRTRIEVAEDDPTQDTVSDTVKKFIAQSLRRFKLSSDDEEYNRAEGIIDVGMVDGEDQWDSDIIAKRRAEDRPCLTVNRFIPMISYIANEQRQMRVGVQVHPNGGGSDPDTARILQGLVRNIENESHAETVYSIAFESMLEKGWSWLRVLSEYENETSFHQVLKIMGFVNDFCVYTDPGAKEPTRKDMKWAHIIEDIPIGEYVSLHPDADIASLTSLRGRGDDLKLWVTGEYIRVAEYYYVDFEPAQLVQLVDGSGVWKEDIEEIDGVYFNKKTKDPVPVEFDEKGKPIERESRRRRVKWCKHNAVEILEGNPEKTAGRDMKAAWIPLIRVTGRERFVKGQRRTSGMVRHNREAQRVYNYLVSGFVEGVALAPKAPYVVAAGQISQYKTIWTSLNTKNWPYLPYDPMTKDMQAVPPPQRQAIEPPIQSLGQGVAQFDNMLKAGFNISDSALGKRGSQESGKAMLLGKQHSDSGNMNWIDNLSRAVVHCGDVVIDLAASRYDAPRVVQIIRPDEERQEVLINQMFTNEKGDPQIYDLAKGKYSCTVMAGQTYATKRQEALTNMFGLMEADPSLFRIIGHIVMGEMDWPGAEKIQAVLKKALPPELRDQEEGDQIPPEVKQQMQQLMQAYTELQQQFQEAQATIEGQKVQSDAKLEIARLQAQTTMAVAAAKFGSAEGMKNLEIEFKRVAELLKDSRERQKLKEPPSTQ